jgi:hypothetical protein
MLFDSELHTLLSAVVGALLLLVRILTAESFAVLLRAALLVLHAFVY